jgi:hypothetical protein
VKKSGQNVDNTAICREIRADFGSPRRQWQVFVVASQVAPEAQSVGAAQGAAPHAVPAQA